MSSPQFDDPAEGAALDLNPLLGRLLLLKPHRIEHQVPTVHGAQDATVSDVIILDGPDAGTKYDSVFIWPKVLQSNLAPTVGTGRFQLGRLTQGTAKPGQSPPWKLVAGTDADRALASRYLTGAMPTRAPATPAQTVSATNAYDEPPF